MTYKFAADKIENIFNHELEHVDRLCNLVEHDPDWISKTTWINTVENCVDTYVAAARTVIEIYIELSNGECENWRELHTLLWDFREKLSTTVEHAKEIIDRPF